MCACSCWHFQSPCNRRKSCPEASARALQSVRSRIVADCVSARFNWSGPRYAWLLLCFAGLLPCSADASMVTVQTTGLTASAPIFVEDLGNVLDPFGPNWKASADILNGELKAFVSHDSTNNNLTGFPFANAFMSDSSTYSGPAFRFTPPTMSVDASYLQVAGFPQTGIRTMGGTLQANYFVTDPNGNTSSAVVQHGIVYEVAFDGSARVISLSPPNTIVTGGANVMVNSADASGIDFDFVMPSFMLNPGDTWSLSGALSVTTAATGFRNQSTIDAFNTAQLSLTLPAGISLNDFAFGGANPYVPTWVTTSGAVPEPPALAVWCLGMAFVAGCRVSQFLKRRARSMHHDNTDSSSSPAAACRSFLSTRDLAL